MGFYSAEEFDPSIAINGEGTLQSIENSDSTNKSAVHESLLNSFDKLISAQQCKLIWATLYSRIKDREAGEAWLRQVYQHIGVDGTRNLTVKEYHDLMNVITEIKSVEDLSMVPPKGLMTKRSAKELV